MSFSAFPLPPLTTLFPISTIAKPEHFFASLSWIGHMQYRQLGRSELSVSVVCLGSWSIATKDFFWDNQQRADSLATVHAALAAGINFFDTAPAYGEGDAEEILGEALAGRRREVVVATKVRPTDLEPDRLRASCETSLRTCGPTISICCKSIGPTMPFRWSRPAARWRTSAARERSATWVSRTSGRAISTSWRS